ncbi:hypothetical protein BGX26_004480 [Mortierella sp. AD094]|nr:hypothetical protein BGX26_004480 [Mortierella sp. AD094]
MLEAQNTIIDGRHIRIEQARVNRTLFVLRFRRTMTEQACPIVVNQLNITSQDLISMLEQYGPVEDVSIFHDLGSLSNKRYAFAKFAYRDDAIRAYMSLRSNSKWTVEWAPNLSCQNQIEKESVFIGQLNPDLVTETALRERFQVYGNIQHIHLVKRNRPGTNRPTAFAFIEFDDEHSAKEAIEGENETTFLRTTIRVQHREASEYRIQRQNAAIQAARSLSIPRLVIPPPIGMSTQHLNTAEYCGGYQPYQSSGVEGAMYSTTYYTYPPTGMPMAGMGFIPVPQLGAMYLRQGGGPQGSTMTHDLSQGYYQGFMAYNGQPKNTAMERESGQETAQTNHENGYVQSSEGLFYSQAIPAQVYLYDQSPSAASLTPNMQLAPSLPPFHPMWLGLPRPRCNSPKRASTGNMSQKMFYTPSSQGRQPESTSPPGSSSLSQSCKAA